jgi:[phosphatase 2A protein]-leucine-carboxy methyltransferase
MHRSGPPLSASGAHSALSPDGAIRSTDTDALVSRSSAASLGYLSDPFASLFLPPALRRSTEKRPPLINIGTHARTWAVDELVEQFLSSEEGKGRCQVLSLGAGTDTRYWRMRKQWHEKGRMWCCQRWVEVDFEEATSGKARTIVGKQLLKDALEGVVKIGSSFLLF